LALTEDQATKEDEYQIFLHLWFNIGRQDANTDVKPNEDQLTELVLCKYDERVGEVGIVFVWRTKDKVVNINVKYYLKCKNILPPLSSQPVREPHSHQTATKQPSITNTKVTSRPARKLDGFEELSNSTHVWYNLSSLQSKAAVLFVITLQNLIDQWGSTVCVHSKFKLKLTEFMHEKNTHLIFLVLCLKSQLVTQLFREFVNPLF